MGRIFALVDCNNFYAACERVFNPAIRTKPVVVLSNNDGCIIARSPEAKALGIEMGAPYFKHRPFLEQNDVQVFSSNYPLYGDMSERVMKTLKEFSPELEAYSIDEAFVELTGIQEDIDEYGRAMRETIGKWTGLPVSIGIGSSKTLAKMASEYAKDNKWTGGVHCLMEDEARQDCLHAMPIEEVWGIGPAYTQFLRRNNITTAAGLTEQRDGWIKQHLTIVGLRLVHELRGTSCVSLEMLAPGKQSICTSRSFGTPMTDSNRLREALTQFTTRAAEKMREEGQAAQFVDVFISTGRHVAPAEQHSAHKVISLPYATDYTPMLLKYVLAGMERIFQQGIRYKKAGVVLMGMTPRSSTQLNVFTESPSPYQGQLMNTVDALNSKLGKGAVRFATECTDQQWARKAEMCSPEYTTRWDDIPTAVAR